MNHSQAVICRNIIKDLITDLADRIQIDKEHAAMYWKRATPETDDGEDSFDLLNENRDSIRRNKRKLQALEVLSARLKWIARAENVMADWNSRVPVEEITDEDYRIFED